MDTGAARVIAGRDSLARRVKPAEEAGAREEREESVHARALRVAQERRASQTRIAQQRIKLALEARVRAAELENCHEKHVVAKSAFANVNDRSRRMLVTALTILVVSAGILFAVSLQP